MANMHGKSFGEFVVAILMIGVNIYYIHDVGRFSTSDFWSLLIIDVVFPVLALPLGVSSRKFVLSSSLLFVGSICYVLIWSIGELASV